MEEYCDKFCRGVLGIEVVLVPVLNDWREPIRNQTLLDLSFENRGRVAHPLKPAQIRVAHYLRCLQMGIPKFERFGILLLSFLLQRGTPPLEWAYADGKNAKQT